MKNTKNSIPNVITWLLLVFNSFYSVAYAAHGQHAAHVTHAPESPSFLPAFAEVKGQYLPSYLLITDRKDRPLKKVRVDFSSYRGEWVPLEKISKDFIKLLLLSEDQRFYFHGGVDWPSMLNATWRQLWAWRERGGRGGASTITMQLVKLFKQKKLQNKFQDKLQQMRDARKLEQLWQKNEILEAYLNLVFFRGELQGVAAACEKLLKKEVSTLSTDDAMLLTVLIRSPNARAEMIIRRIELLQERIKKSDEDLWRRSSDKEQLRVWVLQLLSKKNDSDKVSIDKISNDEESILPAVGAGIGAGVGAGTVGTKKLIRKLSVDAEIQALVKRIANVQIKNLAGRNVADAAVVVLENSSGEVLAYLANIGSDSSAPSVDGVAARRQAGSILKPFLYAEIIGRRILTMNSILIDSPLALAVEGGDYNPQNYDHKFYGEVPLKV
ncbi:MAG: transglycosylase domain-containing protein, partial [Oligoflexia bacterium]|nr:transglycosylase domain-containing protein [Oligoflexia bacterium]